MTQTKKYTKQEITAMADRCYDRCWHCHRYESGGSSGSGGTYLFSYASSGCYEAHDLPWEKGHWCPFWGNKNHPDAKILRNLTWQNVDSDTVMPEPAHYTLRHKIIAANPEIAQDITYFNNSNESRDQYFNHTENGCFFDLGTVHVYCETLTRYRFSHVDSRALYPGHNEWMRPIMICYDPKTYKIVEHSVLTGDGIQISFACSPDKNYRLADSIFSYDKAKKIISAKFFDQKQQQQVGLSTLSLGHIL